jgi:hypothetical protein
MRQCADVCGRLEIQTLRFAQCLGPGKRQHQSTCARGVDPVLPGSDLNGASSSTKHHCQSFLRCALQQPKGLSRRTPAASARRRLPTAWERHLRDEDERKKAPSGSDLFRRWRHSSTALHVAACLAKRRSTWQPIRAPTRSLVNGWPASTQHPVFRQAPAGDRRSDTGHTRWFGNRFQSRVESQDRSNRGFGTRCAGRSLVCANTKSGRDCERERDLSGREQRCCGYCVGLVGRCTTRRQVLAFNKARKTRTVARSSAKRIATSHLHEKARCYAGSGCCMGLGDVS